MLECSIVIHGTGVRWDKAFDKSMAIPQVTSLVGLVKLYRAGGLELFFSFGGYTTQ